MARSIETIKAEIIATKQANSSLNFLTSSSSVSIWRMWAYITAVAINIHENIMDMFMAEVESTIAARQSGTPAWYAEKLKEFQVDDSVSIVNGLIRYPIIDPAKQIITRAAYKESGGTLTLKAAKGSIGTLEALSETEKAQAAAYMDKVKFAGTDLAITSTDPDKLRFTAEVFFNGIYDPAEIKTAVELALNEYLEVLPFDANLYINKLIDVVQSVEGVNDCEVSDVTVMEGVTAYPVTRVRELTAGYIVEDDTALYTFDDLITYTAENV